MKLQKIKTIWAYSNYYAICILMICSLYMNYDANMHYDDYVYIETIDNNVKGFTFPQEYPVFFHAWECMLTIDKSELTCKHCFLYLDCEQHNFPLHVLNSDEWKAKKQRMELRELKQDIIILGIIFVIMSVVYYHYWLYKNLREDFEILHIVKWFRILQKTGKE